MHLTRRMRLIWHKLWMIPLVGTTADVVAGEAAKLAGVTVPIPWLFSALGVVGMLGAAVARAYSVPLIPEGLEGPDEVLTRRSRVLGERLGATPVRVFVSDLPKVRGKVDTFIDGHDLFVSKRVAEMPEAERDFVLALVLLVRGPTGRLNSWLLWYVVVYLLLMLSYAVSLHWGITSGGQNLLVGLPLGFFAFKALATRKLGLQLDETDAAKAVRATGNPTAATLALQILASTPAQRMKANQDVASLGKWWDTKGQKAVEASEWYQRELARSSETNQMSSRSISGDSSPELPASETN